MFQTTKKVCLIGPSGAGKSTLLESMSLVEGSVADRAEPAPTNGAYFKLKHANGSRLKIWDTGGSARFQDLMAQYIEDSDCIVVVLPGSKTALAQIQEEYDFDKLRRQFLEHSANTPLLVVFNSREDCQDNIGEAQQREIVLETLGAELCMLSTNVSYDLKTESTQATQGICDFAVPKAPDEQEAEQDDSLCPPTRSCSTLFHSPDHLTKTARAGLGVGLIAGVACFLLLTGPIGWSAGLAAVGLSLLVGVVAGAIAAYKTYRNYNTPLKPLLGISIA